MRKVKTKMFCDEDCNHCGAIRNAQVTLLLNVLLRVYGEGVAEITNDICTNLTCCADCRIDDFCHIGDDSGVSVCEIEIEAKRLARRYKKTLKEEIEKGT